MQLETQWDGGPQRVVCYAYPGCTTRHGIHCLYDGGHGAYPTGGDDLAWHIFKTPPPSFDDVLDTCSPFSSLATMVVVSLSCFALAALLALWGLHRITSKIRAAALAEGSSVPSAPPTSNAPTPQSLNEPLLPDESS